MSTTTWVADVFDVELGRVLNSADIAAGRVEPEEYIAALEGLRELRTTLEALSPRERWVMDARWGLRLTYRAAAEYLGVSAARVRQIEQNSLRMMSWYYGLGREEIAALLDEQARAAYLRERARGAEHMRAKLPYCRALHDAARMALGIEQPPPPPNWRNLVAA